MTARGNIPGYLSVADAAQQLGVGSHRVYELVKSGMVDAQKVSERTTLVEATSILRYQAFGRKAWRPFCPSVAMGALWILSGAEAYCFTYHQRRRALQAFGGRFGCKVPQAFAGGALAHRRFFCRRGDVHGAPIGAECTRSIGGAATTLVATFWLPTGARAGAGLLARVGL